MFSDNLQPSTLQYMGFQFYNMNSLHTLNGKVYMKFSGVIGTTDTTIFVALPEVPAGHNVMDFPNMPFKTNKEK